MSRADKPRDIALTADMLCSYRDAALLNAQALSEEAVILLAAERHARAYFLSVAAIEEVGKALMAFDGLGRNLSDPAVRTKLLTQFEDHSSKITTAFLPLMLTSPKLESEAMKLIDTAIHLKNGREPSMYTDFSRDGTRVTSPTKAVRPVAAKSSAHLAQTLLAAARRHIKSTPTTTRSRVEDKFFSLNQKTFLKMANTADFWQYYIDRVKAGEDAIAPAVARYHDDYFSKGNQYSTANTGDA